MKCTYAEIDCPNVDAVTMQQNKLCINCAYGKPMHWTPLSILSKILMQLDPTYWFKNFNHKYLSIRVDTRCKKGILLDRDNRLLTYHQFKELQSQINDKKTKTRVDTGS